MVIVAAGSARLKSTVTDIKVKVLASDWRIHVVYSKPTVIGFKTVPEPHVTHAP